MGHEALRRSLMYAGVLPFAFGALAIGFDLSHFWIFNDLPTALALYALAIASFMSGIHWTLADGQSRLLLHSNLLVVFPWLLFLVSGDSALYYASLVWVFLKLYLVDRQLAAAGKLSASYMSDRFLVTTLVCILLSAVVLLRLM